MTAMFGRKLVLIKKGRVSVSAEERVNPFQPEIRRLKYALRKNAKRQAYAFLFAALRFYIRSANYLKKKSLELARKIEKKLLKNQTGVTGENGEKREASRYLKMISEYQRKIRLIKEKIREEEEQDKY